MRPRLQLPSDRHPEGRAEGTPVSRHEPDGADPGARRQRRPGRQAADTVAVDRDPGVLRGEVGQVPAARPGGARGDAAGADERLYGHHADAWRAVRRDPLQGSARPDRGPVPQPRARLLQGVGRLSRRAQVLCGKRADDRRPVALRGLRARERRGAGDLRRAPQPGALGEGAGRAAGHSAGHQVLSPGGAFHSLFKLLPLQAGAGRGGSCDKLHNSPQRHPWTSARHGESRSSVWWSAGTSPRSATSGSTRRSRACRPRPAARLARTWCRRRRRRAPRWKRCGAQSRGSRWNSTPESDIDSMRIPVMERKRFMVGKYEVVAQPIPYSTHMLRYTVFVGGKRIGALASMPTESDCRFLESPPAVPPVKIFQVVYRPGRPKKGTLPAARTEENT